VLQQQAPDDGAGAEDEGERTDEDDDDVEEQPEGVVTCGDGAVVGRNEEERHPGAPRAPHGDRTPLGDTLPAPTSAEDAGIFALLDVSPVVQADFHPAAVRLVVERDLGGGGEEAGRLQPGKTTRQLLAAGTLPARAPSVPRGTRPRRRHHAEAGSAATALTVMVKV